MLESFQLYWEHLHHQIEQRTHLKKELQALVVRKKRINLNNKGLSFRVKNGVLEAHQYTRSPSSEKNS